MKYSLFLDSGALPMEQVLFSYRYKIPPYSIVMFPNLHQYRIHRKWKYMNAMCECMISWIPLSFSFLTASHNKNNYYFLRKRYRDRQYERCLLMILYREMAALISATCITRAAAGATEYVK
jgi:hypothetical protein